MLKIFFKNDKAFELTKDATGNYTINNENKKFDISEISEEQFHIIADNKSFSAEILEHNPVEKTFTVKVNGKITTLKVKSEMDLLLEKMGINNMAVQAIKDIKAPMPGKILSIACNVGDELKKGDKVLILEAMKMENILKSPGDGKVKAIKVETGENVEKNQILILFE
ncbi:biotin/lipoyl-containing protein [Chondrinema litorale]|uniref:biotin/lipoyl-containing protein n=1 Tax=Chondrinema litorale TaxID=2994555 RepID=UPI0025430E19|nr:biotin/lipoyl-containing protein [Chondrinema litorale]UZR94130.1 acetyl-CoA carboxylase biotin carboxyl carrier protein subunit [Chondrinema litorale]